MEGLAEVELIWIPLLQPKRQFILHLLLPMIIEMKTLSTCFLFFISFLLLKKQNERAKLKFKGVKNIVWTVKKNRVSTLTNSSVTRSFGMTHNVSHERRRLHLNFFQQLLAVLLLIFNLWQLVYCFTQSPIDQFFSILISLD